MAQRLAACARRALSTDARLPSPRHNALQSVFTVGVPGAGKSYVLDRVYGWWRDRVLLDLDDEIKRHELYDPLAPHLVYDSAEAYAWADARVAARFTNALRERVPRRLLVMDGTGTKVSSRVARMKMARAAGYHVNMLYVRVSLDTALERNRQRARSVPERALVNYFHRIDRAVRCEAKHCDQVHTVDNDYERSADVTLTLPHEHSKLGCVLYPARTIPRPVLDEPLDGLEDAPLLAAAAGPTPKPVERARDERGRVIVPIGIGGDTE